MVYSESLTGALYLDKPDELRPTRTAWQGLERLALDESESVDLIKRFIGEVRHD